AFLELTCSCAVVKAGLKKRNGPLLFAVARILTTGDMNLERKADAKADFTRPLVCTRAACTIVAARVTVDRVVLRQSTHSEITGVYELGNIVTREEFGFGQQCIAYGAGAIYLSHAGNHSILIQDVHRIGIDAQVGALTHTNVVSDCQVRLRICGRAAQVRPAE